MHTGAEASRDAFLIQDWEAIDILHLSTHGMAYATCKEAVHLLLAGVDSEPSRLHYHDILSQDFSLQQLGTSQRVLQSVAERELPTTSCLQHGRASYPVAHIVF